MTIEKSLKKPVGRLEYLLGFAGEAFSAQGEMSLRAMLDWARTIRAKPRSVVPHEKVKKAKKKD